MFPSGLASRLSKFANALINSGASNALFLFAVDRGFKMPASTNALIASLVALCDVCVIVIAVETVKTGIPISPWRRMSVEDPFRICANSLRHFFSRALAVASNSIASLTALLHAAANLPTHKLIPPRASSEFESPMYRVADNPCK